MALRVDHTTRKHKVGRLQTLLVQTVCGLGVSVLLAAQVFAQSAYPSRPIRVIVPLAPGGGSDYTARLIGARLTDRLGQPVVVDNRPAASGIVGTDLVAKAVPDGYTLLLVFSTHAQSAQLFTKLPYDPIKDFAPITEIFATPLVLLVHPSQPVKTMKELIAYAKGNPGKLNYGTSGPGSSPHLMTELLNSMAGMQMTHVPYKGVASVMTALLGGELQVAYSNPVTGAPLWKAGKLRPLGMSALKRSEAFPEIPTIAESGVPGYEALIWYGYMAPAKTPRAIVDRLYEETAAVLKIPDVRQTLVAQGNLIVGSKPDEFAAFISKEAVKWGAIGKRLGVTMD
jgi:tripartite-type tricarboxylate transporter receptor subunit TctC